MIIGISGKISSGKDTVGNIIQYLTSGVNDNEEQDGHVTFEQYMEDYQGDPDYTHWEVRKFADKLKDIVCLLLGCTRMQLEDPEFKEAELGEEWTLYQIHDWSRPIVNQIFVRLEDAQQFIKEHNNSQHSYTYREKTLTPRDLLQLIGTECGRKIIHPDIWVNATFANYKSVDTYRCRLDEQQCMEECKNSKQRSKCDFNILEKQEYPNWLITDMRFPNEKQAVEDRKGITIRVERDIASRTPYKDIDDLVVNGTPEDKMRYNHPSEVSLDNEERWDIVIKNNGNMEDLINMVGSALASYEGILHNS